jgi:upstream activation factor subunit UAF30
MAVDLNGLRPQIRQILSSPGTDLATISAKRVRRRLLEMDALTPEFIKENKDAVDAVISSVYEKVQAGQWGSDDEPEGQEASGSAAAGSGGERDQSSSPRKRRVKAVDGDVGGVGEDDRDTSSPPLKKAKKSGKTSALEQSDAELARQLSNEINSRSRRSTTTRGSTNVRNRNGTVKGGRKAKSSAEVVDSDDDEDSGGERRSSPKKKRAGGGTAKGGFAKEYILRYDRNAAIFVRHLMMLNF